ncbi:MAG: segregation/condensation protein A [Oleiphilus sp.]|nr:MAG: segregation/condensation protein A [Oleiphilus sp.]
MTNSQPTHNPVQEELPLAMVAGQPIKDMPEDLYIPPDALSVILEAFEGPLDLLLYLIRRQNMDILMIDVHEITRQYMHYIETAEAMKFELAAEYLLMAAMLAEIKSRMLLPKPANEEEHEEDPRAELIRRLQQYERFKLAAEDLDRLPRVHRDIALAQVEVDKSGVSKPQVEVSLDELIAALNSVLSRSSMFESHHVAREKLSTRERMSRILARVSEENFVSFYQLFTGAEGRQGVVVTFLAMMELVKEQLIELVQAQPLGPIHLKAKAH